jgi:hypothetical protein
MRILKRPMFRKGGSTGQGIMTGLVDRTNMDVGGRAKELEKTYREILGRPSIDQLLITGGLNLLSGEGAGKGTLGEVATAFKKPTEDLFTDIRARNLAAKKMGIEQAQAEELKKFSGSQLNRIDETGKALSPDRQFAAVEESYRGVYGEGYKARTHAAFDLRVAPKLRQDGKVPKGKISIDKKGNYKTKGKRPGVYIDVENAKVIEFDGNVARELTGYEDLLK